MANGNTPTDFETLTANPKTFYLDSKNGDANGVFRSGSLNEKQPNDGTDAFVYDPLDTHRGENVEGIDPKEKTAALDQTFALSIGKDGLVYHTDPLPNETPLVGCPALSLWLSIDTPDIDLECDLYEIQPDGTSIALWSDLRRLRYRESLREAKLVKPGEIVRCDFNPGLFVARRLMKGSRLAPGRHRGELNLVAKELLLRRNRRRRNSEGRAHLQRAGISRCRAPKRNSTAVALMRSSLEILLRRRSILSCCDDCLRRFGNRNRDSLFARAGNEPLAPLFVSRRRKTFAPVNEGRLGTRLSSNILARWRD